MTSSYFTADDVVMSSLDPAPPSDSHSNSLLYSFSLLKQRVHQVQSLLPILISSSTAADSAAGAIASMGTLIQEIIITASSMMFTCQQMSLGASTPASAAAAVLNRTCSGEEKAQTQPRTQIQNQTQNQTQSFYSSETLENWYADHNYNNTNTDHGNCNENGVENNNNNNNNNNSEEGVSGKNCDIIELEAADLLAKYTHYCQVCGKGFKRDANLRMHMRAHGDEYKSSAALINPLKHGGSGNGSVDGGALKLPSKYSCPQEGCRWNKKHTKFQPLKSMICVKNHYKRSHCPKMYVCKRCNRKNFSVLSDLRTHEKHCGDLRWQCSCGTTFSRKDKLMGHVALFVGHTPATEPALGVGRQGDRLGPPVFGPIKGPTNIR